MRSALEAADQGKVDEARKQLTALNQANRLHPAPYLGLAELAVRSGDLAEAERIITDGLAGAPRASRLYSARAQLFILRQRYEEAAAAYANAIALAPAEARPRLELAELLVEKLKQPEKALLYYDEAIKIEPQNAAARFGLAFALTAMTRLHDAIPVLQDAQRLAPDNPLPSFALGQIYARVLQQDKAFAAFDACLKIQPTFVQARIARGDLLQVMQRTDKAIVEYQQALQMDPKATKALMGLAAAQQVMGQDEAAEANYRRLLGLAPKEPMALNNLAWLLSKRPAQLDEALSLATQAVSLVDAEPSFHDTLGWIYRERNELPQAAGELQRSISLRPTPSAYTHLGQVQLAMGRKDAAVEAFRTAIQLKPGYGPARDALRKLQ